MRLLYIWHLELSIEHRLSSRTNNRHASRSQCWGRCQYKIKSQIFHKVCKTYRSPILYTNGFEPFTSHRSLSLNSLVSHITLYITWGSRTRWASRQGPVLSKDPLLGYTTCDLWFALSTLFPSQHLEMKRTSAFAKVLKWDTRQEYSRWKRDGGANASAAHSVGKSSSINFQCIGHRQMGPEQYCWSSGGNAAFALFVLNAT
jgi:hypothetical protein